MFTASDRPSLSQQSNKYVNENESVGLVMAWGYSSTPGKPHPIATLTTKSHNNWSRISTQSSFKQQKFSSYLKSNTVRVYHKDKYANTVQGKIHCLNSVCGKE